MLFIIAKSTPTNNDLQLIEFIARLATVAIERNKTAEQIKLASRVFNRTHEGIMIRDVNPAFCAITGYSAEEAIGKRSNRSHSQLYKKT